MDANNSTLGITIVSTIGGIIVAYITQVLAKKVQSNKAKNGPKDRMEQMFDGYERLIAAKDRDDARKDANIQALESELAATKQHVNRLEDALSTTKQELSVSREENVELKRMLDEMRREYKNVKPKSGV